MISVDNISVKKGSKLILDEVSADVRPGRFTVILGMNGAGKSTLLKAINHQEKLKAGMIRWNGKRLSGIKPAQLARKRAVLSQSFTPGFPMQVSDLVEMGCYPFQKEVGQKERKRLVFEAIEEVGMTAFYDRDFSSLSGGEQKRVLLAKCLVQLHCGSMDEIPDKYLFLDEPTAAIDIHHSYKILNLVKDWTRLKGVGVLAILHDLNMAAQFADYVIIMQRGKVVCQGSPDEAFQSEHLEEYLGIKSIIREHPVFKCPHITTLPA